MGVPVRFVSDPAGAVALFSSMGHLDAVVDALLGTGSRPGLDPVMAALVEQANQRLTFRLAVDLPTGVDADTGTVTGPAFMAHATATCGLPKIGMYLFPGYECCGAIHVVDISMPRQLLAGAAGVTLLGSPGTVPAMPPRPANVHKNRMGHVLVIAGSPGKAGAAVLVGRAALRTGAGLCTLACHSGCRANLEGLVPDLMVEGLTMDSRPDEEMSAMVRGKNAIVVGPGLGTCNEARDLFQWAFASSQLPVVGDADIFTAFAGDMGRMKRPGPWPTIITPHPGEMSRLTGMTVEAVQKDRIPVAQRVACELGMTVVLKGAHSVIASPDGRTALSVNGTPALAKAGSGDVLAGVLGALLGMGLPAHEAACLGVYLHARSGELAAARLGVHGVMASDLVETVPAAAKEIS
jgi:NAD(P)H-hydrate epimerase